MAPSDGEHDAAGERSDITRVRKPYAAPKVIFSELYARGVGAKIFAPSGTPEFHSTSTPSTS